ncbi:Pectin lyase-like superfamily protein isoform 1 [Hibiscus syriacus]|uniref:Exocyst subunit Exo70 family protein n=1 Tax=Hibiscus syriacus TaxID=106335 RepID=A0A6A2YD01_HIBSY|nr:Pectin lyase-like superfamily protein isoform 1 [Hibiscus syriacus]
MVLFQTSNNHNHLNIQRKGLSPLSKTPIPTFSSPSSPTASMAKQSIQNAESIITKWDVNSSSLTSVTPLFHHNRKEAREYLKCVMDLRGSMHFLASQNLSPHDLVLAQNLMQIAMKRLEKEFYQILASNRERLDPESVSTSLSSDGSASFHYDDNDEAEVDQLKIAGESISEVERDSALAMTDLKAIAECMSTSGYGKDFHIANQFPIINPKRLIENAGSGGGIHPLTQSAINYITSLSDYDRILSDILSVHPPVENPPFPESYFDNPAAIGAAPIHLAWLILVLLCKIDSKAQQYKDLSLSYLFLANNLQFIINQVQTSNLQHLLGDQWLSKHTQKIKQYASSYELVAWNRVFKTLPERTSELSHEAVKDFFKRFNVAFEEVYMKQIVWSVPDGKLRNELKVSIAGKLVPVYKEFYDKYSTISDGDFVRISPDDLGNYLSDLFHGTRISSGSLTSSSSSHSNGCLLR